MLTPAICLVYQRPNSINQSHFVVICDQPRHRATKLSSTSSQAYIALVARISPSGPYYAQRRKFGQTDDIGVCFKDYDSSGGTSRRIH